MCREFKQTNLDPGGFSQMVRISARHVENVMFKIPAKISFARAALTEPLSCCVRNKRRLNLKNGDCAIVVGLGFIGLITAQLLMRDGVSVIGLDLDPARVKFAQKMGIAHAYTGREGRTADVVASATESRGADALVFTAGPSSLIAERLDWIRDGGTMNIFAGFPKDPTAQVNLDKIYHREITLLTSYSPTVEDLREAHRLIVSGEIDIAPFSNDTFPMSRFDEALRQVRGREIYKAILMPQHG
jgi:L-iditol 2-dehydrogenase